MILIVATSEELAMLTASEERVYRRYRLEGKRFEEIAKELRRSKDHVRKLWNAGIKKIRRHRELVENPQYFLHRGKDVLRQGGGHEQLSAPAESMRTIAEMPAELAEPPAHLYEPGVRVRILADLEYRPESEVEAFRMLQTAGLEGVVVEVHEAAEPPWCLVEFTLETVDMFASVPFNILSPL